MGCANNMRKFRCVVTREDEYIIEFDENKINKEWMADFRRHFYNYDDLDEHAEHIAQHRARFGRDFIEGYGIPLVNGKQPWYITSIEECETGINIKIVSEDQNCDVDVEEIK